jgi:hypothetical protein
MGLERIGQTEYPRALNGMGIGNIDGVARLDVWKLVLVWHSLSRTLHWEKLPHEERRKQLILIFRSNNDDIMACQRL